MQQFTMSQSYLNTLKKWSKGLQSVEERRYTEGDELEEVSEDVPQVESMYSLSTRMPGESYRRRLGSLFVVIV